MSPTAKVCVGLTTVIVLGTGAVFAVRREAQLALRSQVQLLGIQHDEVSRLQKANDEARAHQLSAEEMKNLRADHANVERLRTELDALKKKSAAPEAALPSGVAAARSVFLADWRNAGRDSPRATFETALWAASNGDPATLASTLELSVGAKTKAEALFAGLSDDVKARYESPEQLVALLAARSITVTAMTITSEQGEGDLRSLQVVLQQPESPPKRSYFGLHRIDATWRLVVPEGAVDAYAKLLKAPVEGASSK